MSSPSQALKPVYAVQTYFWIFMYKSCIRVVTKHRLIDQFFFLLKIDIAVFLPSSVNIHIPVIFVNNTVLIYQMSVFHEHGSYVIMELLLLEPCLFVEGQKANILQVDVTDKVTVFRWKLFFPIVSFLCLSD